MNFRDKGARKPSVVLHCKRIDGYSRVKIYALPEKRKYRSRVKTRLRIRKTIRLLLLLLTTAAVMVPTFIFMTDVLYLVRGYRATGGEIILWGFMTFGIFQGLDFIF